MAARRVAARRVCASPGRVLYAPARHKNAHGHVSPRTLLITLGRPAT